MPWSWRPSWQISLLLVRRGVSCARTGATSRVVAQRLDVWLPHAGRFEGAVNGGPYEVQWRAWRRPASVRSNSVGDVIAVPGVALQWRGWPHRADSDGGDRSRRPDVTV
jgi:hypothetical protein